MKAKSKTKAAAQATAAVTPSSAPAPRFPHSKTVLLAVTGMSPAILTETVWALANPPAGREKMVPDEIVVLTTTRGQADLERDLFTPRPEWDGRTVWQALRQEILGLQAEVEPQLQFLPPVLLTSPEPSSGRARPLDDIRTFDENAAAAEQILDEVRRLTANDDVRLIASLAGGRKTMGALLHASVSLLGRRHDRLTHILVNEPFDQAGLQPKFFFPGQPGGDHQWRRPNGSTEAVRNAGAVLQLVDVPFAPLHYLFREHLGRLPGGFAELVRSALGLVEELSQSVTIEFDQAEWTVTFDGVPVSLSGRDIPFFSFLYERARTGHHPYPSHRDAYDDFLDFLAEWMAQHPFVTLQFGASDWRDPKQQPDIDHLRKRVDSLRTRLVDQGLGRLIPILFPLRGPLGFPPARVSIL
jgi:CRISPR-associated protein (TIGR02584 family)